MSRTPFGSTWRAPRMRLQRALQRDCATSPVPASWRRSRPTRSFSNCRARRWTRSKPTASSSTGAAGASPVSSAASTRPRPKPTLCWQRCAGTLLRWRRRAQPNSLSARAWRPVRCLRSPGSCKELRNRGYPARSAPGYEKIVKKGKTVLHRRYTVAARLPNGGRTEREGAMATVETVNSIPWWKEPTKDQWLAWVAAWLGWTLDAFDFTIFLLIMLPIAQEFNVPLTAVTIVFTLTLWMRLVGATAAGWLADRMGRKTPLMISIAWYSACNFIAGFSPTFTFLLVFRTLLGIGMGAEWPAGMALAMEQWPIRSRGFMGAVLQGSWGLGTVLSSSAYGLLYDAIGWRGLLWIGVLPALSIVYVRYFVKEPDLWVENRRLQRTQNREVRAPLFSIFKWSMLGNT